MTTLSLIFFVKKNINRVKPFSPIDLEASNMKLDITALTHKLTDLDKKAEELDEILKNVRAEINNVFWDLMELRKDGKKDK